MGKRLPEGPCQPSAARKAPRSQIIIVRGDKLRSFAIRPRLAAALLGLVAILLTGYIAATVYLVFRDEIVATSLVNQNDLRHGYEQRIAALRSEIDRLASHHVADQRALDQRIADLVAQQRSLLERQAALGERQQMLTGLGLAADDVDVELMPFAATPSPTAPAAPAVAPPAPVSADDRAAMAVVPDGKAALNPTATPTADSAPAEVLAAAERTLHVVDAALARLETDQAMAVNTVTLSISERTERVASLLQSLGVEHESLEADVGGPFEPLGSGPITDQAFQTTVAVATDELERLAELRTAAERLPFGRPIDALRVTSGFGSRRDPFLRRPSLHTGVDFRSTTGSAVRVTAPGTVVTAGYVGGYGKMIEVDHGDGVATRYGHLSRIEVRVGEHLAAGEVIGRVGSTGRSTGPHLHYELRMHDRAIDPMRFIRAGSQIRELL